MRNLTIVVPALNEEGTIEITVNEILPVVRCMLDEFEFILVNDGSTDKTGEIMDILKQNNSEVKVIHNPECRGLGWIFKEGIARARYENLTIIPGDHVYNINGLTNLIRAVGSSDLVVSYRINQSQTRKTSRLLLSLLFRSIMAFLFRFNIRDFHSTVVYPVKIVRGLNLRLEGIAYQLEVIVKLLRRRVSFVEIPVTVNPDKSDNSRSLRLKNLLDLIKTVLYLL